MAINLRIGSRGPEVKKLQEALNAKLVPSPKLVPDGSFGNLTLQAVRRFQAANWLVVDGEAGQCTQNAAFGTEGYTPILHTVPFLPQQTPSTCWAASTAMMNRSNEATVIAITPPDLIASDGGLKNFSNTTDPMTGPGRFAAAQGQEGGQAGRRSQARRCQGQGCRMVRAQSVAELRPDRHGV